MANKRKRSTGLATVAGKQYSSKADDSHTRPRQRAAVLLPKGATEPAPDPPPPRRHSLRSTASVITNPDANPAVVDGLDALRASPDGGDIAAGGPAVKLCRGKATGGGFHGATVGEPPATTETNFPPLHPVQELGRRQGHAKIRVPAPVPVTAADDRHDQQPGRNKKQPGSPQHVKVDNAPNTSVVNVSAHEEAEPLGCLLAANVGVMADPERGGPLTGENEMDSVEVEEVKETLSRPPPVNSDYLPLPWKGRLGYACLNTYLRNANPPVFSSRTCRIASILEHRHPLKDTTQPEHPTKNRPDKEQPADVARGQKYVEELGLANVRDIAKMVRWNERYGIKFMRLSSEMFPFASHEEYGYKLAPFAADTLAEVGKVIAELGHRVTTHPGQFTQLGSPRKSVIDNAIRDLVYHDEMLSLLKLPPQQDRDAVMVMHLGGAFGDKPAAIERFRENYAKLPQGVKNRLVLENDDVVWSTHEVLPLCQELNIPFVLDFHHHNILFDATKIREGTKDIVDLFPAILETWSRKNITPKMHYSEPCPDAVTNRSRRKHSPRVMTLPPCPTTMDLMIEAKDKEQAVFELMRTFKLPGFHLFNDIIPNVREDENKPSKPKHKKVTKRGKKQVGELDEAELKMEEELPPPLVPDEEIGMGGPHGRVYWPPGMEEWLRPAKRIVMKKDESSTTPAKKKRKTAGAHDEASLDDDVAGVTGNVKALTKEPAAKPATKRSAPVKNRALKAVPTPSPSDDEDSPLMSELDDGTESERRNTGGTVPVVPARKRSRRVSQKVSYKEDEVDEMSD